MENEEGKRERERWTLRILIPLWIYLLSTFIPRHCSIIKQSPFPHLHSQQRSGLHSADRAPLWTSRNMKSIICLPAVELSAHICRLSPPHTVLDRWSDFSIFPPMSLQWRSIPVCINIFSGNSIYNLIMGVNGVLDGTKNGMFYCMCGACNACKVDVHPRYRWPVTPRLSLYWCVECSSASHQKGQKSRKRFLAGKKKNVLFMKVCKICTNYQFCFVFVCIPVLQVGHRLYQLFYIPVPQTEFWKCGNFLCVCVGTFSVLWTRVPP